MKISKGGTRRGELTIEHKAKISRAINTRNRARVRFRKLYGCDPTPFALDQFVKNEPKTRGSWKF